MADGNAWWLAQTPGWGAVKLRQLLECMGTEKQIIELLMICDSQETYLQWIRTVWAQSDSGIMGETLRIKPQDVRRLWEHRANQKRCQEEFHCWVESGIHFVTINDPEYPQRLRQIYDPPYALYVRGNLPQEDRKAAAVIGARACTGYGVQQGRRLARELASQGVQIISGLAYGVDSEGHWGALESGVQGATYAVLGCGVDICYPAEHERLAARILEQGGGLLSEFPMGTPPMPGQFPMRNRIISGLSDCILVIEARKRSGSLITVDQALEQGREVFALPGRVGDSLSEGCLHLIRNGANILMESGDVMSYLYPNEEICGGNYHNIDKICDKKETTEETKTACSSPELETLASDRHAVYSALDCVGKTMEEIMHITNLSLEEVRYHLFDLLMEDQILETVKGYYSLRL